MKRSLFYILPLMLLVLLSGCRSAMDDAKQGEGVVCFTVNTDNKIDIFNVATRSLNGADPTYSLKIYTGQTLVKQWDDYTTIDGLRLAAGNYRFVVESGEDVAAAIDSPYFRGEQNVVIRAGETSDVRLTARLANVRVSAEMSELIKDNFSDYSLTVAGVKLTKADIMAGKSVYLSASGGSFTWTLDMANNQGTPATFTQQTKGVVACSHYRFKFDIDNSVAENEGQIMLELSVDTTLEHIDVDIDISLEKRELPYFSPTTSFPLGEQIVVNEVTRECNFRIDLLASAGIQSLKIRHSNSWLESQRVPYTFRVNELGETSAADIRTTGIDWSTVISGSTAAWVDFTKLAKTAPLGEYKFYLTLTDNSNQVVEAELYFVVLPDQDHLTKPVQFGAKFAVFNGEWCTLSKPEELSFQYKIKGQADWTVVDKSLIKVGENKKFSARVTGLAPLTTYVVRSYAPASGEKQGQEVEFTTFDAPEIPNMNFDASYWNGVNWFPNASGGNSYWATGNEGVTMSLIGMASNNTDETVDVVKQGGKAVRLKSMPITYALSPVKFAAGSMFTGTYSTDMGNPINSVKFGRPYRGRPLAMKGYYKYWPKVIDNNKYNGGVSGASGTMDKCHIYISLEDWGSATSRPSNPRVIGYGELKSDAEKSTWTEFSIDIEYSDASRLPTHVVVAATASHYGGVFCGGNGSELLIDEFELIWE